jgi:hypothetical protein
MAKRSGRTRVSGLFIAPVAMFLVLGAATRGAHAATITVNTTAMAFKNDKSCGLAEALVAVNNRAAFDGCPAGNGSNDTIQLQANTTYTALAGSPLSAFRPVTIQGAGGTGIDPNVGPRTIINGQALTSTDGSLFKVQDNNGKMTVTFKDLLLLGGGNQPVSAICACGNGNNSTVSLQDVIVWSWTASGVYADAMNLNVQNSYFFNNSTESSGGGIYFSGSSPSLTVSQSTFWLNSAAGTGGAIEWLGLGPSSLTNSTLAFNNADFGGGIDIEGGDPGNATSTFAINSSTIASNSCSESEDCGGGVTEFAGPWLNKYTMNASIVAYNHDADVGQPDYPSDWFTDGDNTVSNSIIYQFGNNGSPAPGSPAVNFGDGGGNSMFRNPGLDYKDQVYSDGGPFFLPVMLFDPVCLATNNCLAIDYLSTLSPSTDERGFPRGVSRDGAVHSKQFDIGALEYDPNTQAETLNVANHSGTVVTVNSSSYSNGHGADLEATGTGAFVTYAMPIPYEGTYHVTVRFATGPNEGIVQLASSTDSTFATGLTVLAPSAGGSTVNLFAATAGFVNVTYKTPVNVDGSIFYQFKVTGKDTRSKAVSGDPTKTGFNVYLDWVDSK